MNRGRSFWPGLQYLSDVIIFRMCRLSFASTLPLTVQVRSESGSSVWRSTPAHGSRPGSSGSSQATSETTRDGVWEARLDFGPGYRVYFAKTGRTVILLLVGGDKRSQSKDINQAKQYWAQYLEEAKHGKA